MNLRRSLSIAAVASILAFGVGCAMSADSTEVTKRSDGLTISEMDEAAGKLVAVFRKDGREITFDMRLGPKMETPPDESTDQPTREIDARVKDAKGQSFFMQMGGDFFLDSSWHMEPLDNFDAADRAADWQLAQDAAAAWRAITLPPTLAELRLGAMEIATSIRNGLDTSTKGEPVGGPVIPGGSGAVEPGLGTKGSLQYGPSTTAKWDYVIYRKDFLAVGEHSAVKLRAFSSGGAIVGQYNSCNHGSCAGSSNVTVKCVMTGYRTDDGTKTRYFYNETGDSMFKQTGGCTTAYNLTGAGHVCNDDTQIQIRAIYNDAPQETGLFGECGLPMLTGAPGCH